MIVYITTQRTREIEIRRALGAHHRDARRLFLRYGALVADSEVAIGLIVSLVVTRVMSAMLFGGEPKDPITYSAVAVSITAIALLATWLSARRASRIEPIVALRAEQ